MTSFISVCFSGRVNLKPVVAKTAQRVRGMLNRKNFEILHGLRAILVFFEQILIKLFAPH